MAISGEFLRRFLNLLSHVLIGIITFDAWIGVIRKYGDDYMYQGISEFDPDRHYRDAHVVLAISSYIFLFGEALLLYSPPNYTNLLSEKATRNLHMGLFGIGGILAIICCCVTLGHGANYTKVHSILGLTSVICIVVSCLIGIAMGAKEEFAEKRSIKNTHNLVGIIGFILGIIAMICIFINHEEPIVPIVLLVVTSILVLYVPIESIINKEGMSPDDF